MALPRSILADVPPTDANLKVVSGKWPEDISGNFFLSSPDPAHKGKHAFFADGVLYRLSLTPGTHGAPAGQLAWRHGVIETPSHRLHKKHPDIWHATPYGFMSPLGYVNAANTAQVPWNDRLFITWDAGRPVEVCPETFQYLGELGSRKSWGETQKLPILPMIPAPAHPVVDPDRNCMWTVTYSPASQRIALIRADLNSGDVKKWPLKDIKLPQTVHTVSQTRDWIVIIDNGYKIDMREIATGERTVTTEPTEPVFLIRKDSLDNLPSGEFVEPKTFRIGPECMHYYADYEDRDGIRVFVEHSTDSDIAYGLRKGDKDLYGNKLPDELAGMYGLALSPPKVSMMEFDPETGEVKETASYSDPERYWNVQTSGMDWSRQGLSKPTLHHVVYNGWKPEGISQRQFDNYKHRIDESKLPQAEQPGVLVSFDWTNSLKPTGDYQFKIDDWVTSPAFAPRNAGAGEDGYTGDKPGGHDGYLVVPVLNDEGFRVELFDAAKVGEGPIATARAEGKHIVPFVIHSSWMPASGPAPKAPRGKFSDDFGDKQLNMIPEALRKSVLEVAEEVDAEIAAHE